MATHELKTDSDVFEAVFDGFKQYEIRFNDRDFQVDDELILRETVSTGKQMAEGALLRYTGREYRCIVHYILRGPIYGLMDGWVVLSIS